MTRCDHAALKRDPVRWAALPLVGVMDDDEEKLELRNCTACMSTLAVEIKEES